jgi:hypothetical protein
MFQTSTILHMIAATTPSMVKHAKGIVNMKCALVIVIWLLLLVSCVDNASRIPGGAKTSAEETNDCDIQAAHPSDILRLAPGKTDDEIVAVLAMRACSAAVERFPNEPRFQFQLGRALTAMKRPEEAAKAFERAASMGYPAANFYRAEAALQAYWDSGSESDLDNAKQLLKEAKDSFAPAAERLRQLVFRKEGFQNPRIVEAFYQGEVEQLNVARILVAHYALGMHEFLSTRWNPEDNDCPAYLVEPAINYELDSACAGDPRNGLERAGYDLALYGAALAGKLLDPVWKGDLQKWREFYQSLGRRDGQYLAGEYGCQSPVTKRLYKGLLQFAKAKKPLSEYAEGLLNGEGLNLFLDSAEQTAEVKEEQETDSN